MPPGPVMTTCWGAWIPLSVGAVADGCLVAFCSRRVVMLHVCVATRCHGWWHQWKPLLLISWQTPGSWPHQICHIIDAYFRGDKHSHVPLDDVLQHEVRLNAGYPDHFAGNLVASRWGGKRGKVQAVVAREVEGYDARHGTQFCRRPSLDGDQSSTETLWLTLWQHDPWAKRVKSSRSHQTNFAYPLSSMHDNIRLDMRFPASRYCICMHVLLDSYAGSAVTVFIVP